MLCTEMIWCQCFLPLHLPVEGFCWRQWCGFRKITLCLILHGLCWPCLMCHEVSISNRLSDFFPYRLRQQMLQMYLEILVEWGESVKWESRRGRSVGLLLPTGNIHVATTKLWGQESRVFQHTCYPNDWYIYHTWYATGRDFKPLWWCWQQIS